MKTKIKDEISWKNYLIKAEQFFETAQGAYGGENWNAVSLNAIHSAISANDAITVYLKGIRSASEKHSDAVDLLLNVFHNNQEAREFSSHLLWLLNRKILLNMKPDYFIEKKRRTQLNTLNVF